MNSRRGIPDLQQAGITTPITWSVYGKLLTIPSKNVSYQYDAAGNRIGKKVGSTSTWYVRDAQGNRLLLLFNKRL